MGETEARWQDQVYDLLRRHDVTQFAYVPDAGHTILIDRSLADPGVHSVALTTEEEGVALLAGADLGGGRGVLLMQSSGVGNCINMLSLIKGGGFPFLTLVSMRGDFGEGNPWQFPMGQATQPVLEAMGVICLRAETPQEALSAVSAALTMAFQAGNAVAVLFKYSAIASESPGRCSIASIYTLKCQLWSTETSPVSAPRKVRLRFAAESCGLANVSKNVFTMTRK